MPMLAHLTAFYSVPLISLLFKKMYISDSLYLQSTRYAGLILKLSTGTVMRKVILLKSHSLSKDENLLLFLFSLRVFYFLPRCVLTSRRLEQGPVPGEGILKYCLTGSLHARAQDWLLHSKILMASSKGPISSDEQVLFNVRRIVWLKKGLYLQTLKNMS